MTEEEKKEFEEFLQWKKEKQEHERTITPTNEILDAPSKDDSKKEPTPPTSNKLSKGEAIGLIFVIIWVLIMIAFLVSHNTNSTPSKEHSDIDIDSVEIFQEDNTEAISRATTQQPNDSITIAKRKALIQQSIHITSARLSAPNSVGGVDAIVYYKNLSNKTIKYFIWDGCAMNAVGDIVDDEIRGQYSFRGRDTGPIKPGKTGGGHWDCIIYNNTAKKLVLTNIIIKYTDGTELQIEENEIESIR